MRWYDPPQKSPRSRGRQYANRSPAAQPGVTRGDHAGSATDFELGSMVTPAFQSPRLPPPAGPNPLKSPRLTGASPKCPTRVASCVQSPRGPRTKPALDPLGLALSAMLSPGCFLVQSVRARTYSGRAVTLVHAKVLTSCRPAGGDEEGSDRRVSLVRYSDIHEPAIGDLCTH